MLDSDAFARSLSLEGARSVVLAFAESSIQLVPDGTLLFHMALIIVMVALLNATFLKPINRVLGERERRTKGRLTEAQRALLTVDERIREYERRLREARAQGYALMEEERAVMSREREKRVADVRSEITSWLSDQKQTLSKNAEQVKVLLKADARNRALEISRHILRREIPQGSITT
ncbi:MAG TPA: hypothetical protein DHU55_18545 [Blastocatellia bacterium]|nr:hypothetical protein [Blastocatellia bacterium]HAF21927.1 hypothetical protein [Blastocatellia bacterium]HCX31745.1 hypothetical protein [Blastocatellia bacterium]